MLANGKYRGKSVVSCLPSEKLRITSLRLADTEAEEIEQVLRKEVAERFGLDPDKDAFGYLPVGSVLEGDETKNELILFAADNETIKSHIEMLEEARLRPVAIDTVPCALFRSFDRSLRRQEDKERTAVFMDVGSRFTTVVFGRGGEISFVKQIAIGGERFNQEVAAKLGIGAEEAEILRRRLQTEQTPLASQGDSIGQELDASARQVVAGAVGAVAEELAREVSLCFRYYTVTFRGKRVERAVLAGGAAYEDILVDVLRRQLSVEIEVAQPLRGFDITNMNFDSDKRGFFSEWSIAVGLSLKGFDGRT
jgi:type IV pilus assembly protein PilM